MAGMRYQPQGQFKIDWTNPVTRGLVVVFHPMLPTINLADNSPIIESYGPGQSWRPMINKTGKALYNGPSGNYSVYSNSSWVGNNLGCATAIVATPRIAVTANSYLLSWQGNGGWNSVSIMMGDGTNPRFCAATNGSGVQLTTGTDNYVLGTPYAVVASAETTTSTQSLFINGSLAARTSYALGNPNYQHKFTLQSPSYTQDAIEISLAIVWNRPLSTAEAASISINPWQIFLSPEEDIDTLVAQVASTSRRALITINGATTEVVDALVGTNHKPLVLYQGLVREQVTSEGVPIILVNGQLRTLASNETLII